MKETNQEAEERIGDIFIRGLKMSTGQIHKGYDVRVAMGSAWALGKIKCEKAIPALIKAFEFSPRDWDDRQILWESFFENALAEIGEPAIEPLARFIEDNEGHYYRCHAFSTLGKIGGTRAIEILTAFVNNRKEDVTNRHKDESYAVGNAIENLGKMGEQAVNALLEIAKYGNGWFEILVVNALEKTKSPKVVEFLLSILQDREGYYGIHRCKAISILGNIGDLRAVGPLTEASKEEGWTCSFSNVPVEARRVLDKLSP